MSDALAEPVPLSFDERCADIVGLYLDGAISYEECAEQLRRLSDREKRRVTN